MLDGQQDIIGSARQLLCTLDALRPYDIKSIDDFAEFLFAKAFDGERIARGTKGYDVNTPSYGRVQVKHRRLPDSGRKEARLHCKNVDPNCFDSLGGIVFNSDFTVRAAFLIARDACWPTIRDSTYSEKKIPYDVLAALPGAENVTDQINRVMC